jgi:sugar/nucleoside kinase (ribokinase family)
MRPVWWSLLEPQGRSLYGNSQFRVPAFRVAVRYTHCAGAAFSGGLLYGLLRGWHMEESLTWACASGALRCERGHEEPMPQFDELLAVVASGERMATPAA